MYVFPTDRQVEQFSERDPDQPMLMINLVRFRENAFYPEDSNFTPCSGEVAFEKRYAFPAFRIAEKMGIRMLSAEPVEQIFIGPDDEAWDRFYLLWYPNTHCFLDLLVTPEYIELAVHRKAGALDARMIVCDGKSWTF